MSVALVSDKKVQINQARCGLLFLCCCSCCCPQPYGGRYYLGTTPCAQVYMYGAQFVTCVCLQSISSRGSSADREHHGYLLLIGNMLLTIYSLYAESKVRLSSHPLGCKQKTFDTDATADLCCLTAVHWAARSTTKLTPKTRRSLFFSSHSSKPRQALTEAILLQYDH